MEQFGKAMGQNCKTNFNLKRNLKLNLSELIMKYETFDLSRFKWAP